MTIETPCSLSDDKDAWFITKGGRQYPDDDLLTVEEVDAIRAEIPIDLSFTDWETEEERLIDAAEAEKVRLALIRRRKARDACFECPIRLKCLDTRLKDESLTAGIWGGYYPNEIEAILEERNRRQ